ncbi:3186_t:CDS:2 [Paraglomus occultum]|uniref:3186_t:CDS:1 n=1 Tax=Paraglomus occultum TaxID=144539 RepID=A0A9N8ZAK1_9GLOM|nr:3186_t:CDS:2 [Paraglomus occultum]
MEELQKEWSHIALRLLRLLRLIKARALTNEIKGGKQQFSQIQHHGSQISHPEPLFRFDDDRARLTDEQKSDWGGFRSFSWPCGVAAQPHSKHDGGKNQYCFSPNSCESYGSPTFPKINIGIGTVSAYGHRKLIHYFDSTSAVVKLHHNQARWRKRLIMFLHEFLGSYGSPTFPKINIGIGTVSATMEEKVNNVSPRIPRIVWAKINIGIGTVSTYGHRKLIGEGKKWAEVFTDFDEQQITDPKADYGTQLIVSTEG